MALSPDHPRACGVHGAKPKGGFRAAGSSPRLRGALWAIDVLNLDPRIIPAPAGCTRRAGSRGRDRAGSSPRLRGARSPTVAKVDFARIIPAPAGCTQRASHSTSSSADHPRACGVHYRGLDDGRRIGGSSPRLRGAHRQVADIERIARIIPAPAGCTIYSPVTSYMPPDHPRACGVHANTSISASADFGSSPRLRGALAQPQRLFAIGRIIPAPAGCTNGR